MTTAPRNTDVRFVLLLLLLVAVIFSDILVLGSGLYYRDVQRDYYPTRSTFRDIVLGGEIPYWNPRFNSGQPFAANPGFNTFYPPQWLVLLPSYRFGFNLAALLHFWIAGAGMYGLLRSLSLRPTSALLGGFTYVAGGLLPSLTNLLPFLYSASWLPLVLLYTRRAIREGRRSDIALAAMSFGAMLLIAEQSMILQTGALIAAYALYAMRTEGPPRRRTLGITALILAAGLFVGAVQIVPALDLKNDSGRSEPFSYHTATGWSMPPARPLEMIYPDVFDRFSSAILRFWPKSWYRHLRYPLVLSFYPGLFAAVLVLGGFAARIRGSIPVALGLLVSYLVAIGDNGPLYSLLYRAGLNTIRYPEKFFIIAFFVVVVFAAIAFDELERVRRYALRITLVAGGVATLLIAFSFTERYREMAARLWVSSGEELSTLVAQSRLGWATSASLSIAVAALLALFPRMNAAKWALAAAVVVVIDLGPRLNGLVPRIGAKYFDPPPVAAALRPGPIPIRIYNEADWQRRTNPADFPPARWPWFARNALLPRSTATWGWSAALEVDNTNTLLKPSTELSAVAFGLRGLQRGDRLPLLLTMAGVTHMTELRPDGLGPNAGLEDFDPLHVTELPESTRYYFAEQLVAARTTGDIFQHLASRTMYPPRTVFAAAPARVPAAGTVDRVVERANRIELDVTSTGEGLLAIAVTRHKYWSATVDGAAATLIPANIAFQAVSVPRGKHRVIIRYFNPLVFWCGVVSLTTVALLIAVAIRRPRLTSATDQGT